MIKLCTGNWSLAPRAQSLLAGDRAADLRRIPVQPAIAYGVTARCGRPPWAAQAANRATVTGTTNRPIVAIAKTLKQASSPATVQARTPAPGRPALRHSPYPASAAAAKGAPAASRAPQPLTPTRVADPLAMVPELDTLCD